MNELIVRILFLTTIVVIVIFYVNFYFATRKICSNLKCDN